MLTRCPKCQTLFRISESQLQRARGKTRCGQCFTVFEAKKATVEENTPRTPQRRPQQRPQNPQEATPADQTQQPGMSNAASSIYNEMVIKNQSVKYDIPDTLDDDNAKINDFSIPGTPAPRPTAAPAPSTFPQEQHSEEVTRRIDELRRKANKSGLEPASNQALDQQLNYELQPPPSRNEAADNNFIPEVLQDDLYEEVHIPSARKNYFMILGILGLLFILLLQYVYFSRERLASNPNFHPYMVKFCKLFKCKVPYRSNLKLMTMRSFTPQRLRSNNKLGVINAVFYNRATYVQPYPTIELKVENKNGELVAMRRIYPEAYLPKNKLGDIKKGLEPRKPITLEIIFKIPTKEDPSVQYKFR